MGLEPTRPKWPTDFKSVMSTYSIISAFLSQYVKDRFDSLKLSVSIIEMIMSKIVKIFFN